MVSDINIKGTNHKIGGIQADGQWVEKRVTVFSGQNWSATGTQTYTISNYLPDNIYTYEILVSCYATTGATSGNTCSWWVKNADNQFDGVMGYCRTRTASNVASGNSCILPVRQVNGVLTFLIGVTNTGALGGQGLYVTAYRRLGGTGTPPTYYTLTINPTPADATVTFNKGTVVGKTCTVTAGTSVTYTVSKSEYTTQSATVTVNSDQTVNVSLVYTPYSPNQVLYESSTGGASSTLNLKIAGKYQVICVAGGGGGAFHMNANYNPRFRGAGGGSGSGFNCVFQLSSGNYAVAVGSGGARVSNATGTAGTGGDSRFGTCYARGGSGGKVGVSGASAGSGGASPTLTYTRTTTTLNKAGNSGKYDTGTQVDGVSGGAAVYSSYGKGGDGYNGTPHNSVAGTAGYVKVIYIGA